MPDPLPTGTLTLLSSDVEGSASVLRTLGDAAPSNLAIMDVDEGRPEEALTGLPGAMAMDRERGDTWAVVAATAMREALAEALS